MVEATLCLLLKGNPVEEILLGLKKAGFGEGKYGGFGGKIEGNETAEMAAVREMEEEASIKVSQKALQRVGHLTFLFPAKPEWSQVVHVFLSRSWEGNPEESSEMIPAWFKINEIPFDKMWQDSVYWLPPVVEGKKVKARFAFKEDNESIDEVEIQMG